MTIPVQWCLYCDVKKAVPAHWPYCSRNCLVYDKAYKG